jgi:Ca2+-binding EF-hand superfamily protein
MPSVKSSDSISSVTDLLTDLEVDLSTDFRSYPSIKDYYIASSNSATRSLQLQSGLSNYSGLVLGDDRISVSKSVANATYGPAVEAMMSFDLPSLGKSAKTRRAEYLEASRRVGSADVDRLERIMKNKFIQRSSQNSSLYRVNNAFKFFDRDESYRIPIEGFIRALEFLGFQFSDVQHVALFARYDNEFEGVIPYAQFISNALFSSPSDDMMPRRVNVDAMTLSGFSPLDEDKGLPYNQVVTVSKID